MRFDFLFCFFFPTHQVAQSEEEVEKIRREVPVQMIRSMLPHANDQQRQQLREMLVVLK